MTVALKRNVPGYVDELGRFRPIRSASYIGGKSAPRKAKASDRKKYSKAKAGDLGKARQERALEDPWDRDARLEREAKAAEKREQDRITRELEREIYGETSGRTSRGKAMSLAQFIRSEGGINTKKTVRKGRTRYGDSLENFTRKGSGTTGLVTTTPGKGKSLDYMHQAARQAGYDVDSMDALLDALDNEIRSGKKTYSTHGSMTYNPRTKKNPSVHQTIFDQLGGNKFVVMTGAKMFGHSPNSLQFRLPANFASGGINFVRITLNGRDLYDVEFGKFRGLKYTAVKIDKDIYADSLRDLFTRRTGLDTSLGTMGRRNPAAKTTAKASAYNHRDRSDFDVMTYTNSFGKTKVDVYGPFGTFNSFDSKAAAEAWIKDRIQKKNPIRVLKHKFYVGQKLATRSIGDHDVIYRGTVVSRTPKFVTVKVEGYREPKRCGVKLHDGSEYIFPLGSYSMAPVFRAEKGERVGNPAAKKNPIARYKVGDHVRYITGGEVMEIVGIFNNSLKPGTFRPGYSVKGLESGNEHDSTGAGFTKVKKNPDLLSMFANAAVGIASTLQINEMVKSRKRKAAPKKRGTTKAKASGKRLAVSRKRKNPTQPKVTTRKGDLYVLTIGSGDDLISVYLHDGDKDGFSKRFKTLAAAKAYASRNKVKLVDNPKTNGIIKRAWARSRAASEYRRELRLEAAAERSRKRRQKAETAARSNPAARRGALAKLPAGAEIEWNGRLFLVRVPSVSRQFIGSGKTKTEAVNAALAAIKRQKNPVRSTNGKTAVARSAKANPHADHVLAQQGQHGLISRNETMADAREKSKRFPDRVVVAWRNVYRKRSTSYGFNTQKHDAGFKVGQKRIDNHSGEKAIGFVSNVIGVFRNGRSVSAKAPARKNPRSTARRRTFEMFQGRKVTTARPMVVSNHAPANLDQLGDLIELKIAGGPTLKFNGKTAKLCAANGKLWIAGKRFAKPNPSAPANEINPIGEIDHVVYGTRKPHHGDHDYTHYIHKLGEESGKRPILCVDREGYPVIKGGNYKIEARGIVD